MNAITFHVPNEIQTKIRAIAKARGVSVDSLLGDFTAHMVREYEAYELFRQMATHGQSELQEALELLRR